MLAHEKALLDSTEDGKRIIAGVGKMDSTEPLDSRRSTGTYTEVRIRIREHGGSTATVASVPISV